MKKKPRHVVDFSLPAHLELGNSDVSFTAKNARGSVLGKILVSRGGIKVLPKNAKSGATRTLSWTSLFEFTS